MPQPRFPENASELIPDRDPLGTRVNLANAYRPKVFEDVWGQTHPVRVLAGAIRHGKLERNILMSGTVGSGKTTLLRIYARALNCERPTTAGSPCLTCKFCKNVVGLHEYDVGRLGSDRDDVLEWIKPFRHGPGDHRADLVFFDEAHGLTKAACDALLKVSEETPPGVLFCFATTEPERLPHALRSRLLKLEVRPLSDDDSIKFLRQFAERERIPYEIEGLAMIAAILGGYPRDLLSSLEQFAGDPPIKITRRSVQNVFGADQGEIITAYFLELARGDIAEASRIFFKWAETPDDKLRWLRSMLTSAYYNDILHLEVVFDAFSNAMSAERARIVDAFCRQLRMAPDKLAKPWQRMMKFWESAGSDADHQVIGLRVVLFHDLVRSVYEAAHQSKWGSEPEKLTNEFENVGEPSPNNSPAEGLYLEEADVRHLINASSALIQAEGRCFDTRLDINFSRLGAREERRAREMAREFLTEFEASIFAESRPWSIPVWLSVFEHDQANFILKLLTQLPAETKGNLTKWAGRWVDEHGGARDAITWRHKEVRGKGANKFHWREVFDLCAGLDREIEAFDPETNHTRPLCKLLGIKKVRLLAPVHDPIVQMSAHLRSIADDGSSLPLLSPYDDQAWSSIATGWEWQEHRDRMVARSTDAAGAPPKLRQRSWLGWWQPKGV